MNASETKTESKTGRPWWEVDGWEDISAEERETIREDARAVDAAILEAGDETLARGFRNAKQEGSERSRESREAIVRHRFATQYFKAVRQRLRGTSGGDGDASAGEVAAGPGHRRDSSAGESGET